MHIWLLVALLAQGANAQVAAAPAPPSTAAVGRAYFLYLNGLTLEDANDVAGAIESFRAAIALMPESADIHAELAVLYAQQNQLTEARAEATAALAAAPDNRGANRLFGFLEAASIDTAPADARDKTTASAIAHLERAAAGDTGDAPLQLTLGDLYVRHKDVQKAIPLLQKFIADEPDDAAALRFLTKAYELNGQFDEAAKTMDALDQVRPDPMEFRVRQIRRLEQAERWPDAVAAWADVIGQDPVTTIYRLRYAGALANMGDFTKARQALVDETTEMPKNISAWYLLALVEGRANNAAASDAAVQHITKIDPKDPRAPLAVAHVRAQKKDYAGVVKALEGRVASPLPTDITSDFYTEMALTLSQAYNDLGKKRRVTEVLENASKRSPDDEVLLFRLAAAYDDEHRYDEAEKSLRTLIKHDGEHADALNYLGYMFAEQGRNLPEAVELITKALAIERDNPSYLDSLGWAYFKMGELDKARLPLERAAAALPKASVINEHLGDVYVQLQRYGDAAQAFDRALAGDKDGIDAGAVTKKRDHARALAGHS